MFSCRTRGFCPSCHAKRLEEWAEWMREELVLNVPHRQVVFTIPRMLRIIAFVADKPPPPRIAYQEVLMAAEAGSEYFL